MGTASPRMQRLRATLAGPPGLEAFRDVFDLVAESPRFRDLPPWRDEREREAASAETERALEGWDDALRDYPLASRHLLDGDVVKPWARLLRRITFYRLEDGTREARVLAASPHLRDLRQIVVTRTGGDVLGPFAASTEVRGLRLLRVHDSHPAEETWERLATAPFLASLERLELSEIGVTPSQLNRWLDGAPGRGLRELELRYVPQAGELLLDVLLPRKALAGRLTALTADHCFLRDRHAAALAGASDLRGLRVLDLRGNDQISAAGRKAVREAPQFRSTRVIFD